MGEGLHPIIRTSQKAHRAPGMEAGDGGREGKGGWRQGG